MRKIKVIHVKRAGYQWCVTDQYGWAIMWFDRPSLARKARHYYRAYLTVKTDKEADNIIDKVKALGMEQ